MDCAPSPTDPPEGGGGNVLVVLIDDVGVDKVGAWGEHPTPAQTPNLDAFARAGVRFRHAFGQPVCSPARAALLTGRSASRTGIGTTVRPGADGFDLPDDELTLPELLDDAPTGPWATAAVGKWHLSTLDDAGARGPLDHGFDRFLGLLENPDFAVHPDGRRLGYRHWEKSTDGALALVDGYLVTAQTDDALASIGSLPEPWFVYVAYSGAHLPEHTPPAELADPVVEEGGPARLDAMIQALDAELGRLLDGVGPDVTVVVASDNGTEAYGVRPPADPARAKDTLFDGGVRVPLAIGGPRVARPGAVVDALVHLVDVFATVADLAGVDVRDLGRPIDGVSLLPWLSDPDRPSARRCLVIDRFPDNGRPAFRRDRSVRDDRYLLVRPDDGPDELYERFDGPVSAGPDLLRADPRPSETDRAYRRLLRGLTERAR